MQALTPLLAAIWREACRHIDIVESAATIAGLLAAERPVARVVVVEFDGAQGVARAVVTTGAGPPAVNATPVQVLTGPELARLTAWAERQTVAQPHDAVRHEPLLARVLPRVPGGETLVGGLASEHGVRGLLLLEAAPGAAFEGVDVALAGRLLEPFAAALDNHHRLHELEALREAAEADRRSLLARLGRDSLAEPLIGADGGLRPLMDRLALVRGSGVPVLILGETGSGKEVVAREIHMQSPRAAGPFIRVNCGALPPELLDSELFGHEKGAFTGAASRRRGWFERADGGTLFLDEIGELPAAAQVRLLRVLQDGIIQRVGGEESLRVDVRIVAATHRDLAAMVQDGRFREDLWYRLAVFPLLIPPLRERRDDIPALAEHFATRASARFGVRLRLPDAADLALLRDYPWPGNVRELQAVIDRATILGGGRELAVAVALGAPAVAPVPSPAAVPADPDAVPAPATIVPLDEAMRRHVEAALAATHGRVEGRHGAAALLRINPHTLRARMRKLGVDWSRYRRGDVPGESTKPAVR